MKPKVRGPSRDDVDKHTFEPGPRKKAQNIVATSTVTIKMRVNSMR